MPVTASNNPFECSPVIIGGEPNALLEIGPFSRAGNEFTIPAFRTWRLSGIIRTNPLPFIFTILPESEGFSRKDIIVATVSGFAYRTGTPYTDIVTSPDVGPNEILVREYTITGEDVDGGSGTIIGNPYIEKNVYIETSAYAGDGKLFINNSANYILLDPTITEIKGLILGDASNNFSGRPNYMTNKTGHDITIRHGNATVDIPIILPNSVDFILKNGFTMPLIWSSDGDVEGSLRLVESGYAPVTKNSYPDGYFSMTIVSSGVTLINVGLTVGGSFNSGTTSAGGVADFGMRYLAITSAATAGSFINYRQNPMVGMETLYVKLIHESFFAIGNTELLSTVRTLNGFVRYANMSMGNIEPSLGAICAFGNNSDDANLQLMYRGIDGVVNKIDLGADFPARYTRWQHFYKTTIELLGNSFAIASIKCLVTGKSWTSPVVGCHHTGGNSFSYVNHMNNNTEAIAVVSLFVGQINTLNYGI